MLKIKYATFFLYICIKFIISNAEDILNATDTVGIEVGKPKSVGIEVVDYHDCKNVDYAPIDCLKYGEKYYGFDRIPKVTWFEALHNCRRNHGNLLTIESAAEMKAFSDHFEPARRSTTRAYALWTAGNDLVKDGEFMSVGNGLQLNYTNWAANQPIVNNREHCVRLQVENGELVMFNSNCLMQLPYICELNTTIPNRVEYN